MVNNVEGEGWPFLLLYFQLNSSVDDLLKESVLKYHKQEQKVSQDRNTGAELLSKSIRSTFH